MTTRLIEILRSWWWVIYVFIYPLLIARIKIMDRFEIYKVHAWFTLSWIIIGLLLEWTNHNGLKISDVKKINFSTFKMYPSLFFALLYGFWATISAFFTSEPATSLTGTLAEGVEGATWYLMVSVVFSLIYIRCIVDKKLSDRILLALVYSATLLSLGAILEIVLRRGIVYDIPQTSIPMVTFPQKGHLSGYLIFALGGLLSLIIKKYQSTLLMIIILISFSIGITENRAVLVSILVLFIIFFFLNIKSWRRVLILFSVLISAYFFGNFFVRNANFMSTRNLNDTQSINVRFIYWKSAIAMILKKPIFGWGAEGYYGHWTDALTYNEISQAMRIDFNLQYSSNNGIYFIIKKNNRSQLVTVAAWRSHNQILEISLLHGIIGLMIFFAIIFSAFSSKLLRKNHGFFSLIAYSCFLILWFIPIESSGVVWAILAISCTPKTMNLAVKIEV